MNYYKIIKGAAPEKMFYVFLQTFFRLPTLSAYRSGLAVPLIPRKTPDSGYSISTKPIVYTLCNNNTKDVVYSQMPQTNRKLRFWIVISAIWFLLATVVALYMAYHFMSDAPSYFDLGEFHRFFIISNMPLIIGWVIWWKAPGLLKDVDNFFTGSGRKDESIDRLRRMISDGLHFLNKPVHTEQELENWKTDDKNWVNAVYRELESAFDESIAESFRSVESVQEYDIASSFNSEHNTRKLLLNKRLNNLINIIKESI